VPKNSHFHFMATGVGTLPHQDPLQAVDDVLGRIKEMPYWPQLPHRTPMEDMNLQYSGALRPLLVPDPDNRALKAYPDLGREQALAALYERLFSEDRESFGLTPETAAGFFTFLDRLGQPGKKSCPWVKGHVTGPFTLASSVLGADGKALLYDDEAAEAIARGLGAAAAAQSRQMAPLGSRQLIFIDEPSLSGFGSAFTPISRERAIELLGLTLEEARQRTEEPVFYGIHCCGNTDWAMLIEAGFEVINLDSAGYGQGLLLYPEAVHDLFKRGGAVAWGAVPTLEFKGSETGPELWAVLHQTLKELEEKGLPRELIASQALVSPACGLGPIGDLDKARRILDLTVEVSQLARQEFV
jgi:methionine synthase II (cobalamin-independent)